MATVESNLDEPISVILLKNPSAGHTDPYTSHFVSRSTSSPSSCFEPVYVPVLEHTYDAGPILQMLSQFCLCTHGERQTTENFPYGGFIFTSQRAVEAFTLAFDSFGPELDPNLTKERLDQLRRLAIPLYAVGPATSRSLEDVRQSHLPCCWVADGEQTGTGELLAKKILEEYNDFYNMKTTTERKKPLLFLAGKKHRDIVPDTLMSAPGDQRIQVETFILYTTSESTSFASNITNTLNATSTARIRWIVIFSPTGGESLLRALEWLEDSKIVNNDRRAKTGTFIATIGPTTRDYMNKLFECSVDVCAETPSPDGVRKGIEEFMRTQSQHPS
ncbi:MAG: hypothetical protein Q9168_000202 [Polycauliona sp. 1 TL-2023]